MGIIVVNFHTKVSSSSVSIVLKGIDIKICRFNELKFNFETWYGYRIRKKIIPEPDPGV
jgi:hypothetical protein